MKKFLLYSVLILALIAGILHFIAIPKARKNIEDYLSNTGFKDATIENATFAINGLKIDKTTLDKDGFNTAHNVNVNIFWPSYFFNSEIKSISIERLNISSIANSPKDILMYKNNLHIKDIARQNIEIKNIIWDIAAQQKALRLEGYLNISASDEAKKIKAQLKAAQHEFNLNSQWSGTVEENGNYKIESLFDGLSIHTKVFTLNRGTGFITFQSEKDDIHITSQLDAGNGSLLGVPAKNINILISEDNNAYPVLVRASASGIEDVHLYGDFKFSNDIQKQAFDLSVSTKNAQDFTSYLQQQNILTDDIQLDTYSNKPMRLGFKYMPENRFADGPLPFAINVREDSKESLNGTFLIYPDSLDIRGNAQGNKSSIALLQTLFHISNGNISEDSLRFDNNIKKLF